MRQAARVVEGEAASAKDLRWNVARCGPRESEPGSEARSSFSATTYRTLDKMATAGAAKSRLNYNKWDALEVSSPVHPATNRSPAHARSAQLSDDSDVEVHPNVSAAVDLRTPAACSRCSSPRWTRSR